MSLNKRKTKIIVNVTSGSLEESIDLTRYAEIKKADAVVLAPQYQQEMDGREYVQEFIIETMNPNWEESTPVILYNNPGITKGRNIPYEQICQLSELPGIIGIKDSSSDLGYFLKLFNLKSPSFSVLLGSERLLKDNPFLSIDGFVSGTGNIEPDLVKRFFAGRKGKDLERMSMYLDEYSKFDSVIEGIKHIAYKQGIISSAEMVKQK